MGFLEIMEHLTLLSPLLQIFGLAIAIYYFQKLSSPYKLLSYYLLMALLFDVMGRYLDVVYHKNLILIPIFAFCELIILSVLYLKFLLKGQNRILIPIVLAEIYIGYEINYLWSVAPEQFQSYAKVPANFIIILMSILLFFKEISRR